MGGTSASSGKMGGGGAVRAGREWGHAEGSAQGVRSADCAADLPQMQMPCISSPFRPARLLHSVLIAGGITTEHDPQLYAGHLFFRADAGVPGPQHWPCCLPSASFV